MALTARMQEFERKQHHMCIISVDDYTGNLFSLDINT